MVSKVKLEGTSDKKQATRNKQPETRSQKQAPNNQNVSIFIIVKRSK
jgi:hypothetical protein